MSLPFLCLNIFLYQTKIKNGSFQRVPQKSQRTQGQTHLLGRQARVANSQAATHES